MVKSKPCQTGGQLDSDTFPFGECSHVSAINQHVPDGDLHKRLRWAHWSPHGRPGTR